MKTFTKVIIACGTGAHALRSLASSTQVQTAKHDKAVEVCDGRATPITELYNGIARATKNQPVTSVNAPAAVKALALCYLLIQGCEWQDALAITDFKFNVEEALEEISSCYNLDESESDKLKKLWKQVRDEIKPRADKNAILAKYQPKMKKLRKTARHYLTPARSVHVEAIQEDGFMGYNVIIDGKRFGDDTVKWIEENCQDSVTFNREDKTFTVRTRYSYINDWIQRANLKSEAGYWNNLAEKQAHPRPFVPFPGKEAVKKFFGGFNKRQAEDRRLRLEMVLENVLQDNDVCRDFISFHERKRQENERHVEQLLDGLENFCCC